MKRWVFGPWAVAVLLVVWVGAACGAGPRENRTGGTNGRAAEVGEVAMSGFSITSPAFDSGAWVPALFTADGADVSPELQIHNAPEGTVSFALIMDDPDAPMGTWVHWVVWNIPAGTKIIPEDGVPSGSVEGKNSWGRTGYGGPSPPKGTGVHRYFFKIYALKTSLKLPSSADKKDLLAAMEGHVLAHAELVGKYTRDR